MQRTENPSSSADKVSYSNCSWLSYVLFGWVNPVVETGVQRQVTLDDLPELAESEDALVNTRALLKSLDESEKARKSHPLMRALSYTYWPEFLILQTLRVAQHFLGLLDPILMAKVLVFQERQNAGQKMTGEEIRNGFLSVSALITLGFFMIFFNNHMAFFQNKLTIRIGSALRGAVLFRCIEGHGVGSRSGGPSAYNVISFDIDPIITIIWIILGIWLFPVQFISTLYILFQHVGSAIIPGVCTIIIAKLLIGVLLYRDGILRHELLEAKDRRLRYCNEGFTHIRCLHMLAWREPFQQQIMNARAKELHAQKMRLWMTKMAAALDYSLSMIVSFATLGWYVYNTGGELKASVAIPTILLITNLIGPIGQFPVWINEYLVWKSAYLRLSAFIGLHNHPKDGPAAIGNAPGGPPSTLFGHPDAQPVDIGDKVVALKECSLSWGVAANAAQDNIEEGQPLLEQNVFELQNLDLGVRGGELLVVVGLEGQGKSSMLLGLLGEMTVKSGKAYSPAIARHAAERDSRPSLPGLPATVKITRQKAESDALEDQVKNVNTSAVPFCEQNAMLFTASIRWNILFGSPYQPVLYRTVVKACALEEDLTTMPAGDLTEVAQAGATLSGGQKRRISLARSVYRAALALQQQPNVAPLVLLDDPLCSLDKTVATEVSDALFGANGLLAKCAVVVATADPWWVGRIQPVGDADASQGPVRIALLRSGVIAYLGAPDPDEIQGKGLDELEGFFTAPGTDDQSGPDAASSQAPQIPQLPTNQSNFQSNPQGDEDDMNEQAFPVEKAPVKETQTPRVDGETQTELTEAQKEALHVVKAEERDQGQVKWSTYQAYGEAVGLGKLVACATALTGIMVFQNFCNLWITYWTADDKRGSFVYESLQMVGITPPTEHHLLLWVFGALVLCFTLCNFAGHALELIGGIAAAQSLFEKAVQGAFKRPFRWWDANPTGRVLNRFSEDVQIMDNAITNIMGVIFGAVLFFAGHTVILAIANPMCLLLLPFIAAGLEFYAQYYRMTIREVHRIFRVRMGTLYQDMLEAIVGRVTVRSFVREDQVMESAIDNLDRYQQTAFTKMSLALWLGLRMACIGYILTFWVKLRPILQYYGVVGEKSAALVGFSMTYSTETVAIIQQFISNFSDLEMQLISIERLAAYDPEEERRHALEDAHGVPSQGLQLRDVTVTYRVGLLPALRGISLGFKPGEIAAIVGRTGAGKSSLLLSILQLVPYEGTITVDGEFLANMAPEDVRRRIIGVVPQQPVLYEGTLRWNMDPEDLYPDGKIWEALAAVGLESKCRGASGLCVKVSGSRFDAMANEDEEVETVEFSAGQQQMLCAARVLLRKPKVAMLDEVAASLPSEAASTMVSTLVGRFKEHNTTVLLVTHQENLLLCCERILRFAAGRIIGDSRS